MKTKIALLILAASVSGSALAKDVKECQAVDQKQIEALFDRWNESLQTGNAQTVADNYLSDAVLLPTVSNHVRLTDAERKDYFEHFLQKKPFGKIDTRTIRIGCNKAIDAGTYTFTFKDNTSVSARYTFTYAFDGKQWLISTHHSSAMPETK
ncbi:MULTISPECIES: SgcJ/EcaC family oxidoreductase [Winslowiella]|uniref:SgcJ/EcaC family oxidoreductase n=1 Tax=Winslowiella TaxID=2997349 RepID=UPI0028BF3DF1|nr:SgcJ/EcaC family oxidoreductase [Winslowiella toletana]WNN43966.1 SgcJ/EcaC family oxidoreductase [Winslowiella toletana]